MTLVNRIPVATATDTLRPGVGAALDASAVLDRDLEARWAGQLRASRVAFATLVLQLPEVYREFILDGDLSGPRLGHRWPLVQLETCFRRMSRCAPVHDDPATQRIVAELRSHKGKIDRAHQALVLANLRLAIRVGKPLNGYEIAKLRQQLAAVSDPGGLRSLEAEEVWEILRNVASSPSRDPREAEHRERVIDTLSALTPQQERVVRLRFGIGPDADHTLAQIGKILGLSVDRVRHLERSALWKLGTTREVLDMDRYLCRERNVA